MTERDQVEIPQTMGERIKKLKDLLNNKSSIEDASYKYRREMEDHFSITIKEKEINIKTFEKNLEGKLSIRERSRIKKQLKTEQKKLKKLEENRSGMLMALNSLDSKVSKVNEEINSYLNNFRYGTKYDGELKGIDLAGRNLTNLDFSNLDLEKANLAATMSESLKLSHSNLSGSNLSMAVMRRPKLVQTNLTGAKFNEDIEKNKINIQIPEKFRENKGAYFGGKGTSFVGTILDNTCLNNVNFELVDMDCAHVKGTTFCKSTKFVDQTMLFGIDFNEANIEEVNFKKTYMGKDQEEILKNKGADTTGTTAISVERVKIALKDRLQAEKEFRQTEPIDNNLNSVSWQQKEEKRKTINRDLNLTYPD